MTASVSLYVAGHRIPGITKPLGSHDAVDQPSSSPMGPIIPDQETHAFEFAHLSTGGVCHNAIEAWATGGIPTIFGAHHIMLVRIDLASSPMRRTCNLQVPMTRQIDQERPAEANLGTTRPFNSPRPEGGRAISGFRGSTKDAKSQCFRRSQHCTNSVNRQLAGFCDQTPG